MPKCLNLLHPCGTVLSHCIGPCTFCSPYCLVKAQLAPKCVCNATTQGPHVCDNMCAQLHKDQDPYATDAEYMCAPPMSTKQYACQFGHKLELKMCGMQHTD